MTADDRQDDDQQDDEWVPWIEMETIRDPISPWVVVGAGWCLLMTLVTLAVLLR